MKFLEDLEILEKIFVYRPTPVPEMSLIEKIFGAMRKYGDNTLLFVRPADADHAAGTVEIARPGLMIEIHRRIAAAKAITTRVPNFTSWLQICWGPIASANRRTKRTRHTTFFRTPIRLQADQGDQWPHPRSTRNCSKLFVTYL